MQCTHRDTYIYTLPILTSFLDSSYTVYLIISFLSVLLLYLIFSYLTENPPILHSKESRNFIKPSLNDFIHPKIIHTTTTLIPLKNKLATLVLTSHNYLNNYTILITSTIIYEQNNFFFWDILAHFAHHVHHCTSYFILKINSYFKKHIKIIIITKKTSILHIKLYPLLSRYQTYIIFIIIISQ